MNTPSRRFTEYLLAATAVFVSVSTLGVYLYQAKVMGEQQKVSVWPYLEIYSGNVQDYHITAHNKGVGPALIRKVEMSLDGRPFGSTQDLVRAVGGENAARGCIFSSLEGRVLAPGEHISPLLIPDVEQGRAFEAQLRGRRFEWSITYCSIYGDCWVTKDDKVRRLPKVDLGLY